MQLLLNIDLPDHSIIQAFCWMLIHSLWQGLLFTVITGVVLQLTTRCGAVVRYNIVSALFFAFIAVCLFTFLYQLGYTPNEAEVLQKSAATNISTQPLSNLMFRCIGYLSTGAPFIVVLWFLIFCIKTARLITAFMYHSEVKDHTVIPVTEWRSRVAVLAEGLQIKKTIQLLESKIVKVPVVIGHLKPVIFIPVGLLTNLPAGEVEAVLLHELAHIRRNDYLVNLLQVITESIFFFNPALLWLSNVLREERENCCDDIAVGHSASKKQYLQALVSFREHAILATRYAPAFYTCKNQLLKRVTRILTSRNHSLDNVGKKFVVVSSVLLALFLLAATNTGKILQSTKGLKKDEAEIRSVQPNENQVLAGESTVSGLNNGNLEHPTSIVRTAVLASAKPANKATVLRSKKLHGDEPMQKMANKPVNENIGDITQTTVYVTYDIPGAQREGVMSRLQAEKDREQAQKDKIQADLDRLQAEKDREQAFQDRRQAMLDREQAKKDRQQAEKDRERAEKERLHYSTQKATT